MVNFLLKCGFCCVWLCCFYSIIFNDAFRLFLFNVCNANIILAPFLLFIVQILLALFFLPCSPLTLLAGILWGWKLGLVYAICGTLSASICSFFLGKYILTDSLSPRLKINWYNGLKKLLIRYDWKASAFAHGNPIFPGSSLGYVFGLSSISFKSFLIGAAIGTFPLQVLIVSTGHFFLSASLDASNIGSTFTAVGFLFIVFLYLIFVPKVIKSGE